MAGRPSKQLRFSDLLHCLQTSFSRITDLRDTIDVHDNTEIAGIFKEFLIRLQRSGQLKNYRYLNESYLEALDGSDYSSKYETGNTISS